MGVHKCYLCGCDPGPFFVWTTSRRFPRINLFKLRNIKTKAEMYNVSKEGYPVCPDCLNKLKEEHE